MKELVRKYCGEQEALSRQTLGAASVPQNEEGIKQLIVSGLSSVFCIYNTGPQNKEGIKQLIVNVLSSVFCIYNTGPQNEEGI